MASDRIEKLVATLADGTHIIEHADGRLEKRKTQTDWTRLAAMTEKTIEAGARSDPDNPPLDDAFLAKMQPVELPRKRRVTMMLDSDIIEHFSGRGRGATKPASTPCSGDTWKPSARPDRAPVH